MKIYFVGSIAGKEKYSINYIKTVRFLKSQGHEVFENTLVPKKEYVYSMDTIKKMDQWACVKRWITNCDIVIADVTHPSIGIGFEIATAVSLSKKVLAIYCVPGSQHFLQGINSEFLTVRKYDPDNLKKLAPEIFVEKFSLDSMFTVFLPVKMINFIDKEATRKNLTRTKLFKQLFSKKAISPS